TALAVAASLVTETPAAPQQPTGNSAAASKQTMQSAETETIASLLAESSVVPEKASPMVRRQARERGIELSQVEGSGPDGRILGKDLEGFLQKQEEVKVEKPVEIAPSKPDVEAAPQPLSRMRAAIARTVLEAWRTIPHFTVTVAIEMGEAEAARREMKEAGAAVSLNDLLVKGAAMSLVKFPQVNGSFYEGGIVIHPEINIGVAVALDEGLLVPVIRSCQGLSLREIAGKSRDMVERARKGGISEQEISGGTFTISNLGMLGVEEFKALIQPPQGAILAVGGIRDEAVVKDGHVTIARMMRVTLSADHRLIDGAYAARFLSELKRILENPVVMLV
ncbi:MAG: dihydrolipoamide acetyltransferase family protein, partial [Geobacteraceae bacterium]